MRISRGWRSGRTVEMALASLVVALAATLTPGVAHADCGTELQCGQHCCPLDKPGDACCANDICPGGAPCIDSGNSGGGCSLAAGDASSGGSAGAGLFVFVGLATAMHTVARKRRRRSGLKP